jgi:predicted nucleic acid-binding protein
MKYLLDSGTATDIFDVTSDAYGRLHEKVRTLEDHDELFVSILTHCELEYSFVNASEQVKSKVRKEIDAILRDFSVLPLRGKVAGHYGKLKSCLKERRSISKFNIKRHNIDLLLAATAIEENCILISEDVIYEELTRIEPSLKFETW